MVVQISLSLGQQQVPSWQRTFFGGYCHFTVRITEAGPKSKNTCIPLLETAKIMLLEGRFILHKTNEKFEV